MPAAKFTFENGEGKLLSGLLESPEGTPRGWAIFAHCFTCGKDSRAAVHISRALSRAGIGVLRFDFAGTGVGGAEGEAVDFAADVTDLKSAARAMTTAGMTPALLIGHSLGGTAALVAATDLPDIVAVATIGAPAELEHILKVFNASDLDTIRREGEASVDIAGRPFLIRRSFVDAVEQVDVEKAVAALRRPLLVLHSPSIRWLGSSMRRASLSLLGTRKASYRSMRPITFLQMPPTRTLHPPWSPPGPIATCHPSWPIFRRLRLPMESRPSRRWRASSSSRSAAASIRSTRTSRHRSAD